MNCSKCGAPLKPNAKFCVKCGTKVPEMYLKQRSLRISRMKANKLAKITRET